MPSQTCSWDCLWKRARVISWLFGMVGTASVAFAQLPTGTILGVVRDATGLTPGATLTATNPETGLSRSIVSDEDGSYRFAALPVGRYEVRVALEGFQSAVRSGLTLTVGQEAVVNFTLEVGAITQTVEVTAEASLVNTTSASLGALVDAQAVADLPLNGRNYIDLTFLQAGISKNENMTSGGTFVGSWFSSNGAPLRSNSYMLDGTVMANVLGGSAGSMANSTLGIEGIQEWRVITNTFSAEYGLTMGSQMTIVTKSGTNGFHGSLFEYFRNSALDARNYFDVTTAVTPGRLPPFKRNNYGGSFGGPLKTDKLFFFATYEALRERLGITSVANTIPAECRVEPLPTNGTCRFDGDPTIAPVIKPLLALYPLPNLPGNRVTFPFTQPTDEHYGQGRVDWTISAVDTAFARFTVDDTAQVRPLGFPGFITDRYSKNQYLTVSETHVFSPSLLHTFRVSSSATKLNVTSPTDITGPEYDFVTGKGLGVINIAGIGEFGPRPSAPLIQNQKVFSWSNDLFYTRGAHSLKLGMLINHYRPEFTQGAGSTGQAIFPTVTHFLRGTSSAYTGRAPGSILDSDWRFNTLGFYLQDDWRIGSRVTLNLGLRYEFLTDPAETNGHVSVIRDLRVDANPTCADPRYLPASRRSRNALREPIAAQLQPPAGRGLGRDRRWEDGRARRRRHALRRRHIWYGNHRAQLALLLHQPVERSLYPPAGLPRGPRDEIGKRHRLQSGPAAQHPIQPVGGARIALEHGRHGVLRGHARPRPVPANRGQPAHPARHARHGRQWQRGLQEPGHACFDPTGPKCWLGTETRINRNWAQSNFLVADSNSYYHGLQLQLRKRFSEGLQFQSSYTFSKALDETQGIVDAENTTSHFASTDPFDRLRDRGPSSFDLRHNWSLNAIYRFPQSSTGGALGGLVNGWWMSGILRMRSGYPFTPVLGDDRSRSAVLGGVAGLDRPDLMPGVKAADITKGTSRGCDHIPAGTPVGTPDSLVRPLRVHASARGIPGDGRTKHPARPRPDQPRCVAGEGHAVESPGGKRKGGVPRRGVQRPQSRELRDPGGGCRGHAVGSGRFPRQSR